MNAYLFCVATVVAMAGLILFFNGEEMVPPEWKNEKIFGAAIIVIGALMFGVGIAIILHGDSIPI